MTYQIEPYKTRPRRDRKLDDQFFSSSLREQNVLKVEREEKLTQTSNEMGEALLERQTVFHGKAKSIVVDEANRRIDDLDSTTLANLSHLVDVHLP